MNDASSPVETFIVVADGSTDYLLLRKVIQEDQELAPARVIKMIAPEDVGLTRRTGGGHRTLLRDLGIALIRAAQGYADGVLHWWTMMAMLGFTFLMIVLAKIAGSAKLGQNWKRSNGENP
jgi:hypothetical protein